MIILTEKELREAIDAADEKIDVLDKILDMRLRIGRAAWPDTNAAE